MDERRMTMDDQTDKNTQIVALNGLRNSQRLVLTVESVWWRISSERVTGLGAKGMTGNDHIGGSVVEYRIIIKFLFKTGQKLLFRKSHTTNYRWYCTDTPWLIAPSSHQTVVSSFSSWRERMQSCQNWEDLPNQSLVLNMFQVPCTMMTTTTTPTTEQCLLCN